MRHQSIPFICPLFDILTIFPELTLVELNSVELNFKKLQIEFLVTPHEQHNLN